MRLERTISTSDDAFEVRDKAVAYLQGLGYRPTRSEPTMELQRGSSAGSLLSSSPKKWRSTASLRIEANSANTTEVTVNLDVYTTGQTAIKNGREYLERELDGLVTTLNAEHLGAMLPQIIERDIRERWKLERRLKGGADWFFWIAAMSLLNSVILLFGGGWGFMVGLGITQALDGVALAVAADANPDTGAVVKAIALVGTAITAGIFVFLGISARKGARWAFLTGMILYALDGLIFLVTRDYLSFGFHLFVLIWLFSGLMAIGNLRRSAQTTAVTGLRST